MKNYSRARRHGWFTVLWLVLLPLTGCGDSSQESGLVPINGQVVWRGKPVDSALVHFVPVSQTPGAGGTGRTGPDGSFTVQYVRGGDGLLPGEYKVVVSKMLLPGGAPLPPDAMPADHGAREVIPRQYSDMERTVLIKTVPPDGGHLNIELN